MRGSEMCVTTQQGSCGGDTSVARLYATTFWAAGRLADGRPAWRQAPAQPAGCVGVMPPRSPGLPVTAAVHNAAALLPCCRSKASANTEGVQPLQCATGYRPATEDELDGKVRGRPLVHVPCHRLASCMGGRQGRGSQDAHKFVGCKHAQPAACHPPPVPPCRQATQLLWQTVILPTFSQQTKGQASAGRASLCCRQCIGSWLRNGGYSQHHRGVLVTLGGGAAGCSHRSD